MSGTGWQRGSLTVRAALAAVVAAPLARAADAAGMIFPAGARPAGAPVSAGFASGLNSLTLVVAAALAGAGGWILWRQRRSPANRGRIPALTVDETRALGNRQYLVVASYAGQKFLLGVCPGRIDLLAPLAGASGRPDRE